MPRPIRRVPRRRPAPRAAALLLVAAAVLALAVGWRYRGLAMRVARHVYAMVPTTVRAAASDDEQQPTRPAKPLSDSARARLFRTVIGPYVSVRNASGLGGVFDRYERDFRTFDEQQWAATGPAWASIDYYDRAAIYYTRALRSGEKKYFDRAQEVALDYRHGYLEANNFAIQAHWSMMDGVALHYLATGDEASRSAVGKIADLFTGLKYREYVGDMKLTDNRIQARYLVALLLANTIGAPSVGIGAPVGVRGGRDWAAELRRALPLILSTQDTDGAWRPACKETKPVTHPFTTGLLIDALIRYHDTFEPDPKILPAVQRAVDYLWTHDWLPRARAFKYVGGECPAEGGPVPAPDLNNLIVNGFAWVYRETGDETYKQRADQIFAGAVTGAYIAPAKQFNQQYSLAYRYLAYTRPRLRADTTASP
jgi:hypothetical protein